MPSSAATSGSRYRALQESVNRFGSALRDELGVRPEERVLLLTLDGPEMMYAFFGAIKIGAVPVPLNTLWTASDYDYVLRDARPRVLVVSAPLLPRLGASPLAAYPWLRHIIVVGGEAADGIALVPLLDARLAASRRGADQPRRGGVLAVFVGQHRPSQGLRPPAARHARVRGNLRAGHPANRTW